MTSNFLYSGKLYTVRDAAAKRMAAAGFPFETAGAYVYFAGPSAAPEGCAVGSIGPTTSARMEPYIPLMLEAGIKGFVGKGDLSKDTLALIESRGARYLRAVGGAGALYAGRVREVKIIAYPELGCEAVRELTAEDFPLIWTKS